MMDLKHFKILTDTEVEEFKGMTAKQLEKYVDESIYIYRQPNSSQLEVGRKLYVINGNWYGIVKEDGYMYVYEDRDFTHLVNKTKADESCRLNFYYLSDYKRQKEINAIYLGKTVPVIGGSQTCEHVLQPLTYSGLTCIYCGGGYCE